MAEWTIVLGESNRIERDGEVVAYLWDRKWELLLARLAEAGGVPVSRSSFGKWSTRSRENSQSALPCYAVCLSPASRAALSDQPRVCIS
jgi:hypothetical protein